MIRVRTGLLLLGLLIATGIGWCWYRSAIADDADARLSAARLVIDLAAIDSHSCNPAGRLQNTVPGTSSDDQAQPAAADLDDDDDSDSIVPATPIHCVTRRLMGSSSPARLEPTRSDPQFLTACRLRC